MGVAHGADTAGADRREASRKLLSELRSGRGDDTMGGSVIVTRLDQVVNWGRKFSLWPLPFATACCGIEFMGVAASFFDISRFGSEVMRFSPRQADLLIVAGTITYKEAPILRRIYAQMCDPKWVMAMGVCASSGGFYDNYCTLQGIDKIIPVDYYLAGCPPRPEVILAAIHELQQRLSREPADK